MKMIGQKTPAERMVMQAVQAVSRRLKAGVSVSQISSWGASNHTVMLLVWQTHGVATTLNADLRLSGDAAFAPTPENLMQAVEERLGARFRQQAVLAARFGPARRIKAKEVDVGLLRIDRPIAAHISRMHGAEATHMLRKAISTGTGCAVQRPHGQSYFGNNDTATIEVVRNEVRGQFTVKDGDVSIEWKRGAMTISGVQIPDTLVGTMKGRTLGEVLDHPLFDPAMIITAAQVVNKSDGQRLTLTLKNHLVAFEDHPWPA